MGTPAAAPHSKEVSPIFDWLVDLVEGIGSAIGSVFGGIGDAIATVIFDNFLQWFYNMIYDAVADFFTMMGQMGAQIFDLTWIQAFIRLFFLFGWSLYAVGVVVAVFDVAIEYQSGRGNIKSCCLHILKGFFAASLITVAPVQLYRFCITLQNTFSNDLTVSMLGTAGEDLSTLSAEILATHFLPNGNAIPGLLLLLSLIAFACCVVKVFFDNIKRGGILLTQIAVGSMYMFSVPRGYADGFYSWCKQVAGLCLTAFLQTTLLFLGLLTFSQNMLLGLGIMLAAGEVPKIAQQFGLDSSTKGAMTTIIHSTTMLAQVGRAIAK